MTCIGKKIYDLTSFASTCLLESFLCKRADILMKICITTINRLTMFTVIKRNCLFSILWTQVRQVLSTQIVHILR